MGHWPGRWVDAGRPLWGGRVRPQEAMTIAGLIAHNAFRNKRRLALTVGSVTVSLFLLTVLQVMLRGFTDPAATEHSAARLVVRHKVSLANMLFSKYKARIEAQPGVVACTVAGAPCPANSTAPPSVHNVPKRIARGVGARSSWMVADSPATRGIATAVVGALAIGAAEGSGSTGVAATGVSARADAAVPCASDASRLRTSGSDAAPSTTSAGPATRSCSVPRSACNDAWAGTETTVPDGSVDRPEGTSVHAPLASRRRTPCP